MLTGAYRSHVWHAQPLTEADIFSYALNLEFLECIFYTYAVKVSAFLAVDVHSRYVVAYTWPRRCSAADPSPQVPLQLCRATVSVTGGPTLA